MEQGTVNQRLKFLVESLAESARAFSVAIGESPTNTHNYISGGTKPKPEYLEKLLLQFGNVNARWLLTGEGEPFTEKDAETSLIRVSPKKNKGNIVGKIIGPTTFTTLSDCEKANASLRTENELLRNHLADKERIIRLYEAQQPK